MAKAMRPFAILATLLLTIVGGTFCSAGSEPKDWSAAARGDIDFAHRTLVENHPGSVDALGDSQFQRTLTEAKQIAVAAASTATNRKDYEAALRGFAAAFEDRHIAFVPTESSSRRIPGKDDSEYGPSGFDFDESSGTLAIRLARLDDKAASVVDDLRASGIDASRVTSVAVDLRGNKGGNSGIGDALLMTLFGEQTLARIRKNFRDCPVIWRASPGNAEWLEQLALRFASRYPKRSSYLKATAEQMRKAIHEEEDFVPRVKKGCSVPPTHIITTMRPSLPVPITVRTDSSCFSSCLIFVERLLQLGARQIGETTGSGNWYMEVRVVDLPSGNGRFTLVQKADLRRSKQLGPFIPEGADGE